MTPKEKRDLLFKRERPRVRSLEIMDGENYSQDVALMWAAFKAGSFPELPAEMGQEDFVAHVEDIKAKHDQVYVIDDFSGSYRSGRGPVAMACTNANDLLINVEGCGFKWASRRNMLRCSAAFLQMIKLSKKTGVCIVKGGRPALPLLKKLTQYDLLYFLGNASENEFLFSVRGRASHL